MTLSELRPSRRHTVSAIAVRDDTQRWAAVAERTLSGAASVRITAAYAVVLVGVSLTLSALGPHQECPHLIHLSTGVHR